MYIYFYSAKNNAFVAAESILLQTEEFDDAVEVSNETFTEFFPTEKDGKRRAAGPDGLPIWEEIPEPTPEELHQAAVKEAELKKAELIASATTQISFIQTKLLAGRTLTATEKTTLNLVIDYIDELNAVDTDAAPGINWPLAPEI